MKSNDKLKAVFIACIAVVIVAIIVIIVLLQNLDDSEVTDDVAVEETSIETTAVAQPDPIPMYQLEEVNNDPTKFGLREASDFTPIILYEMIPHSDIDPTKFVINIRNAVGFFENYWYFDYTRYALCLVNDLEIVDGQLVIKDEYVLDLMPIIKASAKTADQTYSAESEEVYVVTSEDTHAAPIVSEEPGTYVNNEGQPYMIDSEGQYVQGYDAFTESDLVTVGRHCGYPVYSGNDYAPRIWAQFVVDVYHSDFEDTAKRIEEAYGTNNLGHAWMFDKLNNYFIILDSATFYEGQAGYEIISADYVNADRFI